MEDNKENLQESRNENNTNVADKTRLFISGLEKVEPFIETFTKALNWISVIIVGTFVWVISSFDKFVVNGVMPIKWLFILASMMLLIAVLFVGICFLFPFIVSLSLKKFDMDTMKKGEKLQVVDVKESLYELSKTMGLLTKVNPPILPACIFYGIGVLLITSYIFAFIFFYL